MSNYDLIMMAVRNLWKRKLRTFLTVLGVIIGTASIVVMVSIGIGMNEGYKAQIEEMGSLQVINVSAPYGGGMMISPNNSGGNKAKDVVINAKAIEDFKKIPGVETATPVMSTWGGILLISGKSVGDVNFIGMNPDAMEALGYKVSEGRLLNNEDTNSIVIGSAVTENFYNPKLSWQMRYEKRPEVNLKEDKLMATYDYQYGQKEADKKVKPYKLELAGILEGSGESSYSVIMPLKELEKMMAEKAKWEQSKNPGSSNNSNKEKAGVYNEAKVKVKELDEVEVVLEQIKEMGYEAYSLSEWLKSMQESTKMLQMGLGAIGAISLFVAAIGITNTMVMAIYERTREIGVMKVIGASLKDIRRLFLTEAAFIGFSGGAIGMLLSFGISKIVNVVGNMNGQATNVSSIPIWLAFAAMGFATIVGIAAGFFPAQRAMRLSALTAIKTE